MATYVLDTSAFIKGVPPELLDGSVYTVPGVIKELKDDFSWVRYEVASVRVKEPEDWAIRRARRRAEVTGDLPRLSETDLKVLALAIELMEEQDVVLVSSDYSVQNVALTLGIRVYGPVHGEIDEIIGPGGRR
ncbi:NOB1 family endonuclease [Methanopyrus sp.]